MPITWPIELERDADEVKFKQHPNLKLAQSSYKRTILFNPENDVLSTILLVAYPSLAVPRRQRSERDHGIIRLVVYLLRNLVAIDEGRNRSDTILAFQKAKALEFLCVLASGMGDEFIEEDVIVLDTMYFLVRGVDPFHIFQPLGAASDSLKNDLSNLLAKEKHMRSDNRKTVHTRHNRFGTMISVVKEARRFTVPSQTAITGNNFAGIEASKKWNKPQQHIKTHEDVDTRISLNTEARLAAGTFVSMFLDAGFNPLFSSVLKALEHDDSRVSQSNRLQFLYLQGWFFKAFREKGKAAQKLAKLGSDFSDDADYQLIAAMMESRATIMLRKMLREGIESKLWKETHAAMDCLKELLLTIHAMSMSSSEEYQDIAENLQSNLYYEESNLDLVASCVRTYTNQSLGYLNTCTDLAIVLLKMLEKFASTKTHMFVRARRQRQRKKKPDTATEAVTAVGSDDEEAEAGAREAVKERAFNFSQFERKFTNNHCLDTFTTLLEFYADLESDQIKRVIQFYHRIFVVQKAELLLYRIDVFELLNRMIKDKLHLSASNPARSEVENFTVYLFKRFSRTLETSPALAWEVLFEKLSDDPYYLNHDANKAPKEPKPPRAPAEFEVRPGFDHEEQVKIAVAVLLDENKSEFLNWFKSAFSDVITTRESWEARQRALNAEITDPSSACLPPADTLRPDSDDIKLLLYKDGKVRLLLKVVKLERLGDRDDADAIWIVPSNLMVDELSNDLQLIKKYTYDPPEFENEKTAQDFIRRQVVVKNSYNTDSSDNTASSDSDADVRPIEERPRKKTWRRPPRKEVTEIDYDAIEARRLKRELLEKQRNSEIKSSKYVNDSDDEDDAAALAIFFAAEEALRERQKSRAANSQNRDTKPPSGKKQKIIKKARQQPVSPVNSSDKENHMGNSLFLSSGSDSDSDAMTQPHTHKQNGTTQSMPESPDASDISALGVKRGRMHSGNALFTRDSSSESEAEGPEYKRLRMLTSKKSVRQLLHSDECE